MFENKIIFNKSIKSLTDINNKVNMIKQKYEPKTKARIDNKERDVSFLGRIKYHFLDCYLDPDAIVDLEDNFERNKIDSILNKYSNEDCGPIRKILIKLKCLETRIKHRHKKLLPQNKIFKTKRRNIKKTTSKKNKQQKTGKI